MTVCHVNLVDTVDWDFATAQRSFKITHPRLFLASQRPLAVQIGPRIFCPHSQCFGSRPRRVDASKIGLCVPFRDPCCQRLQLFHF